MPIGVNLDLGTKVQKKSDIYKYIAVFIYFSSNSYQIRRRRGEEAPERGTIAELVALAVLVRRGGEPERGTIAALGGLAVLVRRARERLAGLVGEKAIGRGGEEARKKKNRRVTAYFYPRMTAELIFLIKPLSTSPGPNS